MSTAITVEIPTYIDTIEYTFARKIIHRLGMGATRKGDHLHVYDGQDCSTLYINMDKTERKELCSLFVDEGSYTDVVCDPALQEDWNSMQMNMPWWEIVGGNGLLLAILKKYAPEKASECHSGSYMGKGYRARHLAGMIQERLIWLRDESSIELPPGVTIAPSSTPEPDAPVDTEAEIQA